MAGIMRKLTLTITITLLAIAPAAAGDDAALLHDGWKTTVPIPEKLWGDPGQYVIWVEGGWLQVRRETAQGESDWHVVLAQATDPRPPTISPPARLPERPAKGKPWFEVSYCDGRYFVREDMSALRTLRQRKPGGAEEWPVAKLDGQHPTMGYCGDPEHPPQLLGGSAEPWYIVAAAPNGHQYDCQLRLTPTWRMKRGGGYGFEAFGSMRRAFAGLNWVLDDGELLVAIRGPAGEPPAVVAVGGAAPKLVARTLDGEPLILAEHRGKFVLLDFWATWCGPCVAEIPRLKEVHDTFGQDERFVMISLSLDEDLKAPRSFVKERSILWPQAFVGDEAGSQVLKDYGVSTIPATFLIGPDGKVIAKGMRGDEIKGAVSKAFAPVSPVLP